MLKNYIAEALEPSLLFSVLCAALGITIAAFYSKVSILNVILLIVGVFFAQMSVNVLNDYTDYKKGIDLETTKTKFSGGSKLIVDKSITAKGTLKLGLFALLIAAIIGVHFILTNFVVWPIIAVGALSILLYTTYFVRVPFLAEFMVIVDFMLIALGSFVVAASSTLHIGSAFLVAFPAGIVIGMCLLTNEIPDMKADQKFGRKNAIIMLKSNSNISLYYLIWQIICYVSLIFGVVTGLLPYSELIIFLSAPLMLICFFAIRKYSNVKKFEKYMGINIIYAILLMVLAIIGYAIVIL